jgi:hypothetical protein
LRFDVPDVAVALGHLRVGDAGDCEHQGGDP